MTAVAESEPSEPIPGATVARLPLYLRGLVDRAEAGVETVSSV